PSTAIRARAVAEHRIDAVPDRRPRFKPVRQERRQPARPPDVPGLSHRQSRLIVKRVQVDRAVQTAVW
ncbi:MAG: hypothetical protein AAF317_03690, partial [Pseudomonadota bacterium]